MNKLTGLVLVLFLAAAHDAGAAVFQVLDDLPGVYALTARVMPKRYGHKVASPPSCEVMVRLDPDDGHAQRVRHSSKDGRQRFAFTSLPKPMSLSLQEDPPCCPVGKETGEHAAECGRVGSPAPTSRYRFLAAAEFPLRDFGARGEVLDRHGAVIYEGMEFLSYDDGQYELSCLVRTPAMPTTLRLQLQIQTGPECCPDHAWRTITLPPIQIDPDKDSGGKAEPGIWRIRHCGYSAAIDRANGKVANVRREGTARFGFGNSL